MEASLRSAASISDQKERAARYKELASGAIAAGNFDAVKQICEHVLHEEVPQMISRAVITHIAESLSGLQADTFQEVATFLIEKIKAHPVAFDEADYIARDKLFSYYIDCQEFSDAAVVLAGVNVESTNRIFTDEEKADLYVKIAEAFLEDDQTAEAELYVNKASSFINAVENWALVLRYKVTYARVLDANRKFIDAAMRYYELSQTQHQDVVQDDLLVLLSKAVTTAVLGKAGPQRSRVLGLLYKDERLKHLEQLPDCSTHAQVLTKMYTEQILRREEMAAFENSLLPHQKAVMADGLTIPERAIIEHNMVAASRIYDNIRFSELGSLLGIDAKRAEKVAARMITEGRLKGSIDQTESLVQFEEDAEELIAWDHKIRDMCNELSECVDAICTAYPHFADVTA